MALMAQEVPPGMLKNLELLMNMEMIQQENQWMLEESDMVEEVLSLRGAADED